MKCTNGVLGQDFAVRLYWAGDTWTNDMNLLMNHAPSARSVLNKKVTSLGDDLPPKGFSEMTARYNIFTENGSYQMVYDFVQFRFVQDRAARTCCTPRGLYYCHPKMPQTGNVIVTKQEHT